VSVVTETYVRESACAQRVVAETDNCRICTGPAEEGKIRGVDGDKDLEAGSSNIPDAPDGAGGEKVSGFVVPQGEDERLKQWPSARKLKGQPGLLTVMVKMQHLLLHHMVGGDGFRAMMSVGGDEGAAEERLLAANELSFWRMRRQRRYLILGFLAVSLEISSKLAYDILLLLLLL
jgi:hypothetical protein